MTRPIQVRPDLTKTQRLVRTAVGVFLVVAVTVSLISLAESTSANHRAAERSKEVAVHAAMLAQRQIILVQQHFCDLFDLLLNTPPPKGSPPPTPAQRRFAGIIRKLHDETKCG